MRGSNTHATNKFEQWKEHLQNTYGKNTLLSKAWLKKEWKKLQKNNATNYNDSLEKTRQDLGDCTRCNLHAKRTNIVFGEGNPHAKLMFVGEGPGEQEDIQGRPFVGRAGQLLDKIIEAMGYKREEVYIGNVVKCRPPSNRQPEPDEVAKCEPFLFRQITCIKPEIIVALGATALKCLLHTEDIKISAVRGKFMEYRGVKLMPTYHPAYLLRNPPAKKEVWEDMKKVMAKLKDPGSPLVGQVDCASAQQDK